MNYQFKITCPYCGIRNLRSFPIDRPTWHKQGVMACDEVSAADNVGCGESFVYSLSIETSAEVAVAKMPELQVLP